MNSKFKIQNSKLFCLHNGNDGKDVYTPLSCGHLPYIRGEIFGSYNGMTIGIAGCDLLCNRIMNRAKKKLKNLFVRLLLKISVIANLLQKQ